MRTCSKCDKPVFGGGYCKYHQYVRHMRGGDLYKPKPRQKSNIPKESKKRKKEKIRYSEQIKLFWIESVENKTDFCFFCGVHMAHRDNIHHLKGRTGDYYLDKEWWVNAHNKCHVEDYHQSDYEHLSKQLWYPQFLQRLKSKDSGLWQKEINKKDKDIKLNPRLGFDEDLFD